MSSRLIGGTIAVNVPILLSQENVLFVSGHVIKIVSVRTGLAVHTLAPLIDQSSSEAVVGLFLSSKNLRQVVVATSLGRLLFYDSDDGVLLRQAVVSGIGKGTLVTRAIQAGEHVFLLTLGNNKSCLCSLNLSTVEATVLYTLPNSAEMSGIVASPTGDFVAWWHRCDVTVFEVKRSAVSVRSHRTEVQAAAFHPRRPLMAIGDRTGRILIWHALDGAGSPIVEQLHWHAHGVNSLLYAGEDGNLLLSGGVEDAIVVWQLETRRKLFVPHLGSLGVYSLAVSANGRSYACVCADNSLFVISAHDLRVTKRILGLRTMGPNLMRTYTRMLASPDGGSVVLTGKPNTLQWYNIEQDACEFELPVLHAAVVPRGRLSSLAPIVGAHHHQKISIPSRVELAVFGRQYLATLDVRSGHKKFKVTTERTLKIWRPKTSGMGFELACVVLRPHRKLVSCLAGNPSGDEFCSTSNDKTWKMWRVMVSETGESSVACVHSNGFKDLKPSCCCFSSDGSVLAVVFQGSVLTLWSPQSGQLLRVVQAAAPSLKTVALAAVPSSPLFVGLVFGHSLWCADVLSMSIRWRLAIKVVDMAVHASGHIAVIDQSGWLLLIHADSPVPIWALLASPEALRVQFVRDGPKTVISVLTKTGMMHLFEAPQVLNSVESDAAASSASSTFAAAGSVVSGGRFDGLLGPAAVVKRPAQQSITGRNSVQFPSSFLADTASHVLPSATIMLSVLLEELVLKKTSDTPEETHGFAAAEEAASMMDLDGDEPIVDSVEEFKLPHHFSSQARGQMVEFFKKTESK